MATTKRLVFVANAYAPLGVGGAELVMQTLAETLRSKGFGVTVVTLSTTANDVREEVNGVPVIRLRRPNLYGPTVPRSEIGSVRRAVFHVLDLWNPIAFFRLRSIFRASRPDIVCTHTLLGFSVSAWAAARSLGIPVIHTLHDQYLTCPRGTRFRNGKMCRTQCRLCQAMSWPRKVASRYVDAVVGVSQSVLDLHRALGYFGDSRANVIFNGRRRLRPVESAGTAPPRSPFTFGFLGRIGQYKGVEVLLEAMRRVSVDCRLLIAGSGDPDYVEAFKAKVVDPRISYLGHSSAADFLQQIDALIVPSLWPEPLPTVIVEAWEFGLPVVGSDIGGIPEMLNLVGGIVVPPNEPTALAAAMVRLVGNPALYSELSRRALVERGRFLPEMNAESFLEFLAGVDCKQSGG